MNSLFHHGAQKVQNTNIDALQEGLTETEEVVPETKEEEHPPSIQEVAEYQKTDLSNEQKIYFPSCAYYFLSCL